MLNIDPINGYRICIFGYSRRAHTIRQYLNRGGMLYIVYPQEGIFQRTPEQRSIYKQELLNHPHTLFDAPITQELPTDTVGATYFVTTADDDKIIFSVQRAVANAPGDKQCWELWFADMDNEKAQVRAGKVLTIAGVVTLQFLRCTF